jgi:hypothetical protein
VADEPLVSVVTPTWQRHRILAERRGSARSRPTGDGGCVAEQYFRREFAAEKSGALKLHPARFPQDFQGVECDGTVSEYPLFWSEILGDIFSPMCYEFRNHIMNTLPTPLFYAYR